MGRTCGGPDEIGLTAIGVKLNGPRRVPGKAPSATSTVTQLSPPSNVSSGPRTSCPSPSSQQPTVLWWSRLICRQNPTIHTMAVSAYVWCGRARSFSRVDRARGTRAREGGIVATFWWRRERAREGETETATSTSTSTATATATATVTATATATTTPQLACVRLGCLACACPRRG